LDRFTTDSHSLEIDYLFLKLEEEREEEFTLGDGARIAVIGGSPSDCLFNLFPDKW
jgi:hypothetical protein